MTVATIHPRIQELIQQLEELDRNLTTGHQSLIDELQKFATEHKDEVVASHALFYQARIKENSGVAAEAVEIYKQLLQIFEKKEVHQKQVDVLNQLGLCTGYLMGKYTEGLSYLQHALSIAENYNYKKGIAASCNNIGVIFYRQGNYSPSLEHYLKSLKIREETGDRNGISTSYNNIGNIYADQGNYPQALDYYLKSLKIREEMGDKNGMAISYNNFGFIYTEQGNYSLALDYYLRSLKIREEMGDKNGVAASYNNIGYIYSEQYNYPLALDYYLRSLKIYEKIGYKNGMATTNNNIGNIYISLNKYNKAKEHQEKALSIAKEIGSVPQAIYSHISMGSILTGEKKFEEAAALLIETLKMANETGEKPQQKDVLEKLYECFKQSGDALKALEFYERFIQLKDELFNEEISRKIAGMQLAAEVEKKEKEKELVKKEAEIERLKNVELKKAYEDLKAAQDELIRKERMAAIGKIASDIAHEVQNPLNFVNNFSELNSEIVKELTDEVKAHGLTETANDLIENLNKNSDSINLNGKRVAGIVSQLLELTRKGEF